MQLFALLLGLLALWGVCLALVRRGGLPAGVAPLAGLSVVLLALLAAGMAGVLGAAKAALLAVGLALALAETITAARRPGDLKALARRMAAPGSLVFWGGALALALWLAWLQPEFMTFDEYSFWGPAAKLTSLYNTLYPACPSGMPWVMTQQAGLPLASYWFQPMGDFSAWAAIFAADAVMLAALAAVVACARQAGRRVWGPVALAALLVPGAFAVAGHTAYLYTAWLEFLGDAPAGVLMGGAVAFWLAVRRQPGGQKWLALPVLCLAGNIKSNTLPLALAAAGLILLDAVLCPPAGAPRGLRPLAGRAAFGLAGLAAPLAQYLLWGRYTAPLVAANAAAGGLGDTTSAALSQVVVNGLRMLLGGTGTAYFEARRADLSAYADAMRSAFVGTKVCLFGSGAAAVAVILAVLAAAFWLAQGRRQKLRVALLAGGSAACFAGYWVMLLLSYAFVLKDSTPQGMASYGRYFGSFYTGWLLLALAMLAAQSAAAPRKTVGQAGALALAAAMAALTFALCEPQFTLLGVGRGQYAEVKAQQALASRAVALTQPQEKLFYVCQGDNGKAWFTAHYAMLPRVLAYGAGGGSYGLPQLAEGAYYQPYTAAEFDALVRDSGADWLLVDRTDAAFAQSYAALFTDGLAETEKGAVLYAVTPQGFAPRYLVTAQGATPLAGAESEVQP